MTAQVKLNEGLLTHLLSIPKMIDWALDAKDLGWQGDGGRCLIHRYLTDTLQGLGVLAQFAVSRTSILFTDARAFTFPLPQDMQDLVNTVDQGATAWISRGRAIDILVWLRDRDKELSVEEAHNILDGTLTVPQATVEKAQALVDGVPA